MAAAKNKKELFNVLKQYMEIEGMSRYEDDVVKALKENTKDSGFKYSRDGMGSLIMRQEGKGPKIQIAAHMDEVGYYVQDILKNGQVRISAVGGIWPTVVIGSKATIIASDGKRYQGIFGHTSVHIMERTAFDKAIKTEDMYVDIGAKDKKEIENLNIEPGSRIYMTAESFQTQNEDFVVGKAIDNRAGVTVIDQVVKNLKDKQTPNDLYVVGTVQEEVGTRGAQTSVSIINPNVAIAIDTCAAHDTYKAKEGIQKLGNGIAFRLKDGGTMMDPKLIQYLFALAKKHNIPAYKYIAQGGDTDASKLQYGKGGVATITLSIPQRYLHSPHGMASLTDIKAAVDLITEFCLAFDDKAWSEMSYS